MLETYYEVILEFVFQRVIAVLGRVDEQAHSCSLDEAKYLKPKRKCAKKQPGSALPWQRCEHPSHCNRERQVAASFHKGKASLEVPPDLGSWHCLFWVVTPPEAGLIQ